MKNDRDDKQNVDDTVRDMKDDPKDAMKADYEQTKADMMSMKAKAKGAWERMKDKMAGDEGKDAPKDPDEDKM